MSSIGVLSATLVVVLFSQAEQEQAGDTMIHRYLSQQADQLHGTFLAGISTQQQWEQQREEYLDQYYYMLGLSPMPEKTTLHATVTGSFQGDGYQVDMLHYQSRPGLYVTGNLYRPASIAPGTRLPAVFYVCGHSPCGRNGNKVRYQSHGIWFARHGYICLVVDSLQLGEIASFHHGTYRESRWWWLSRGYTPAGVECWNGIRGIDYLVGRPDVDPERIAVTGISGGGAASFWIAAADDRVRVAVPVSGMADLPSYVNDRIVNGHCDCMFLHNAYRWPWTRIAALIAPRPLLFVNSDQDRIFPMNANGRITNRLEQMYSLYGCGDHVDSVVSIGGHQYRQDIRQTAYRFINTHLKNDPRNVTDSEIDLVAGKQDDQHPIAPERLRVFPTDQDLPTDARNVTIDETFVPLAHPGMPTVEQWTDWRTGMMQSLREVTFNGFPDQIPQARAAAEAPEGRASSQQTEQLTTEDGITVRLRRFSRDANPATRVLLVVDDRGTYNAAPKFLDGVADKDKAAVYIMEPRGVGATKWTVKNPPNYVQRAHVLLGRTFETGQVWDIVATARMLQARHPDLPICLVGEESGAVLAAYAALLEPSIGELLLHKPCETHQDAAAPQFLNVLRICDLPQIFGLLSPRKLSITGCSDVLTAQVAKYRNIAR